MLTSSRSLSGCSAARLFSSERSTSTWYSSHSSSLKLPQPAMHRVRRDRLPALVPDRARAEHRVELRLPLRLGCGVVEAVAHADAVERRLCVPLDRLRRLDAEGVEDRRDDVDRVVVLVADLAASLRAGRPRDDARVARAAVELVALPHLERRVERHRPAVRVVVVRLRPAELVDHRQVLREVVGDAVGELHLVHRAVRAALAAGAVVGDDDDQRVLELARSPPGSRAGARCGGRRARGSPRRPPPSERRASSPRRSASPTAA